MRSFLLACVLAAILTSISQGADWPQFRGPGGAAQTDDKLPAEWDKDKNVQWKVELPLIDVFGRGGATKSSWYGDCLPSRDFPMLIDLHLQGRLPLEKFVSETIGLDDVEAAFDKMHKGEVLRSVVVF